MYLSVVFFPLMGSVLVGLLGRWFGRMGSIFLTILFVLLSCIGSLTIFFEVGFCGSSVYVETFNWIDSGSLFFNWSFLFDSLTSMMLFVVTSVSFLVHLYSVGYMKQDPHVARFFSYLSLFTFFMLILVSANNLVQLFVGWEGVGVCSYLLINFWHTRVQANKAALKAIIVNRVGDFGVTLGIVLLYFATKSVDFSVIFSIVPYLAGNCVGFLGMNLDLLTLAGILLFVGVIGKSAQIGLHTWLPDAMEGPTPVSALIHAATMVTAGVFLLIRCSFLYEYTGVALLLITFVGASTAFFAATTGVMQNDLKRVIAYSTCSQLGYMVFACGLSAYSVSAFHLMNHAFFKALLFLGAGSVIHALSDEQDMRRMGGLSEVLPLTYVAMVVGSLALMGIPFLAGFYSKDLILEVAFGTFEIKGIFAYWLGVVSAMFTAYYSFRLLYLTFLSKPNGFRSVLLGAHDAPFSMALPLVLLSIGSIFVGFIFRDLLVGLGTSYWGGSILTLPIHYYMLESEFLTGLVKNVPFVFSILGSVLSVLVLSIFKSSIFSLTSTVFGRKGYLYLNRKWFFDTVYNEWICRNVIYVGYWITFKLLDRGFIELIGPFGVEKVVSRISESFVLLHTGYIYHSALSIYLGFFLGSIGLVYLVGMPLKYFLLFCLFVMLSLFSVKR